MLMSLESSLDPFFKDLIEGLLEIQNQENQEKTSKLLYKAFSLQAQVNERKDSQAIEECVVCNLPLSYTETIKLNCNHK